jgi:hypothetical protein
MTSLNFPANPSNGDVYENFVYNAVKGVWKLQGVVANDLDDLNDVEIDSPSDNQILVYDAGNGIWANENQPEIPEYAVDDITDVSINNLQDDQILIYNSTSSVWENSGIPVQDKAIADITDVAISAPSDNELLSYDNSSGDWINQTAAELGIAELSGAAFTGIVSAKNFDINVQTLDYDEDTGVAFASLDFNDPGFEKINLSASDGIEDLRFLFISNIRPGAIKTVKITLANDAGVIDLEFNSSWVFVSGFPDTSISEGKTAILTLTSFGTTDSDIVATWTVQP